MIVRAISISWCCCCCPLPKFLLLSTNLILTKDFSATAEHEQSQLMMADWIILRTKMATTAKIRHNQEILPLQRKRKKVERKLTFIEFWATHPSKIRMTTLALGSRRDRHHRTTTATNKNQMQRDWFLKFFGTSINAWAIADRRVRGIQKALSQGGNKNLSTDLDGILIPRPTTDCHSLHAVGEKMAWHDWKSWWWDLRQSSPKYYSNGKKCRFQYSLDTAIVVSLNCWVTITKKD